MNHLDALPRNLDLYSSEYKRNILLGDFNVEIKRAMHAIVSRTL